MKNYIKQQENFKNFDDLVSAAISTYTLSFKNACRALKCSRSWANKYIRPFVPAIYVTNGKTTDSKGKIINGTNFAAILNKKIHERTGNNEYGSESVYLDEMKFNEYIYSKIVKCQKRSKKISKTYFMDDKVLKSYYRKMFEVVYLYYRKNEIKDVDIDSIFLNYLEEEIRDVLKDNIVLPTKRTDAEFVDVPIPDVNIEDWKAVHDLMDYGDVEETIYRQLFKEGAIRIELMFPDQAGELKSKGKVYYIDDPEPAMKPDERKKLENDVMNSVYEELKASFSQDSLYKDKLKTLDRTKEYILRTNIICIRENFWLNHNINMLGNNITY